MGLLVQSYIKELSLLNSLDEFSRRATLVRIFKWRMERVSIFKELRDVEGLVAQTSQKCRRLSTFGPSRVSKMSLASRSEPEFNWIKLSAFPWCSKVNEIHEAVAVLAHRLERTDGTDPGADTIHSKSVSQPDRKSPDGRNALVLALDHCPPEEQRAGAYLSSRVLP
jgi:hypothetical protein